MHGEISSEKQERYDKAYLRLAESWAELSQCNRKKVGAIIEHPNFYPYMTAYQNLKLVCKIKEIPYETINKTLEIVGLIDRKDSKFSA
mgnify:CR=1 FL=1